MKLLVQIYYTKKVLTEGCKKKVLIQTMGVVQVSGRIQDDV